MQDNPAKSHPCLKPKAAKSAAVLNTAVAEDEGHGAPQKDPKRYQSYTMRRPSRAYDGLLFDISYH